METTATHPHREDISTQHHQHHRSCPTLPAKRDPSKKMRALEWQGKYSVRVAEVPRPLITDPKDALIRVTLTTICGSDLHLYHNEFPEMHKGDILGHEFMGIVEEVGSEVQDIQPGDRVVVSFCIADGDCDYCKKQMYSLCDTTNPSKKMEELYGHKLAGIFGYSHLTGGYEGGQAEYVRVPYADVTCLKVPESLSDEKVLFLSDIVCTAWHANELGKVGEGDIVAVWGCGPVGLLAQMWAKFRGAKRVIAIDNVPYRLQVAREKVGAETIDFSKRDVVEAIRELVPQGPDVCIDAVGFRFPKSFLHKVQRALYLETDSPQVLEEAIKCVRKGGRIGVVGDYMMLANQFPIGAFMEKGLTMAAGQTPVQKYWKELLGYIEEGRFDPTFVITHRMPLEHAARAYWLFDNHEDNMIKAVLRPSPREERRRQI